MKLFQQMLVVGASLGFLAPISAQASNIVDLEEMSSYSRGKKSSLKFDSKTFTNQISKDTASLKKSSRLDSKTFIDENTAGLKGPSNGFEVEQNKFEAGSFSDTTTLDGKAVMWIGAVDGGGEIEQKDSASAGYTYTMNLNTSFTGDDNLYVRLKTGEQGDIWKAKPTYHIETKDNSDAFEVDKIWYTFSPFDDRITAFVGPRIENYYMYITPSIYKPGALKAFKLGGNSNFGASTDIGAGFKFELDNGFGFASNVVDKGADETNGTFAPGNQVKWDTQVAYTTDNWHISGTLSNARNWSSHSYNATTMGAQQARDSIGTALRGYWIPDETGTIVPEVSLGYDTKSYGGVFTAGNTTEANSYFVGLTWKDVFLGDDRIGFAFTQPLAATEVQGGGATGEMDPQLWELYYSFRPNDSMEITPAIFGGNDVLADNDDDIFGLLLTSKFKF